MNEGEGWVEILVEGHAPGAPAGENLTCAALSALMYAAAGVAEELWAAGRLERPPEITLEPGYGRVAAVGDVVGLKAVGKIARTILGGSV